MEWKMYFVGPPDEAIRAAPRLGHLGDGFYLTNLTAHWNRHPKKRRWFRRATPGESVVIATLICQPQPNQPDDSRAFTLIELLLCVAVIAVLIGILLPAMAYARESARNAKCLANLHTIGQAFGEYRGNHRGDAPLPDDLELDAPAWVCPCFAARNRDSTQPHFTQWSFTNPRVYGAILDTRPASKWPITGDMTVANHGGKAVAVGTPPVMQYVLRGGFTNSVYIDGHAGRK